MATSIYLTMEFKVVMQLANQFLSIVIMLRHRVATDENINVVTFLKAVRRTPFKDWGVKARIIFNQRDKSGRFSTRC